jgi:hypothetical protein
MNQNKLKTSLSIAIISKLNSQYNFFTIEKLFKKELAKKAIVSKTLTKVSVKHLNLSKHLSPMDLKYPLVINFFENFDSFIEHLNEKSNKNDVIFISTGQIASKQNLSDKISSLNLFNKFNSLFNSSILLLRCLKLAQKD